MVYDVTCIIATGGNEQRSSALVAAINSLQNQENVTIKILVILNGPTICSNVKNSLYQFKNTKIIDLGVDANYPIARNHGVGLIESEFFCFLDDDDTYIPNTLKYRCQILHDNPDVDAVASNGLVHSSEGSSTRYPEDLNLDNPLYNLFDGTGNWLASCGGLFRTKTIDQSYFRPDVKYYEWTLTAFLLARNKKIRYLAKPTFIINKTPMSLSSSHGYALGHAHFLGLLLKYPLPPDLKRFIKKQKYASLHDASERHLELKNYKKAWLSHLKSLSSWNSLKYLSYTRHIIFSQLNKNS